MKELIYQIIETAGAIERVGSRVLKPFGLTSMTFNILNVLDDGELSQRQLSERLIVHASSVTFQVRRLQRRCLLQRRRADRRTWLVSLTPEGRQRRAAAAAELDRLMARFSVGDARVGTMAALRLLQMQIQTAAAGQLG